MIDGEKLGKKYEIIDRVKGGLKRIRALKDFDDVKSGDLGGFIFSDDCLSHDGNCWAYDGSSLGSHTLAIDDAKIKSSRIYSYAFIKGKAIIENSTVFECTVTDNTVIQNSIVNAKISVKGNSRIISSEIYGQGYLIKNARIDSLHVHYGNLKTNLDNNKDRIRALCNIIPIQGIYTFFVSESWLEDRYVIDPNKNVGSMDDPNLLAVYVHENDIEGVINHAIFIRRYIFFKPVNEEKRTKNMSKLDLILDDD
jgi:hypothetical protein